MPPEAALNTHEPGTAKTRVARLSSVRSVRDQAGGDVQAERNWKG